MFNVAPDGWITHEQARAIVEASGDDDVDMNQALLRLVQQHLFTVLVELNRVDLNRANLPALARSVAGLARTSIEQRKYADEIRFSLAKKVAEAQKEVDKAAARGLTEDGAKQIKRVLMRASEREPNRLGRRWGRARRRRALPIDDAAVCTCGAHLDRAVR